MEQQHKYIGLNDQQIADSIKQFGKNILTPPKKKSILLQFLEKLTNPLIIILLIALTLSAIVSCYEYFFTGESMTVFFEPLGILFAILLATIVGFCFELNANKRFEILNNINDDSVVKVIRNSNVCEISKKEVVVGDIVIIEMGEEVPADGTLHEAISLQINESTLTGELVTKKTTHPENFDKEATYPSNYALRGTTVVDGHGIMEVTHVGDATEYGKVFEGFQVGKMIETPLNQQLNKLVKLISVASFVIAGLIVVGRLLSYFIETNGFEWINFSDYFLKTIMIAIALIVVAVPEGLPMSITLSLVLNMKRMLSVNNLVRKMHACETMGAITVICTDKTGTLTQNQMKIHETKFFNEDGTLITGDVRSSMLYLIQENISINSTAYLDMSDKSKIKVIGNPTEGAFLLWLYENGVNYLSIRENAEIIEQLVFSTERKYMATLAYTPSSGKKILFVKGAPEIILSLCKNICIEPESIHAQLLQYQNKAMRTLGFAYQIIENNNPVIIDNKLSSNLQLSFMGIAAISDPIRSDVPEAIKNCLNAGINIKIVTGDTPGTAKEIGRQIGLWKADEPESNHLTGSEFAAMSDDILLDRIADLKILSRSKPIDKQRLVKLLQKKKQVVAVTGDGTNDVPALSTAQVGLSMGDGTSVAKEASDIVIINNSFKSISMAVLWGRSLYQNIQRFILFQMTINVAACLIVLISAFLGTESPLTVTQMLWINLIMDTFAALALASLPPNEKVMQNKPRKTTEHIITKKMARKILSMGLLFVIILFGLIQYFQHNDITSLTSFSLIDFVCNFFDYRHGDGLSRYELSLFFTTFVMLQFWNMFNVKSFMTGKPSIASLHNSKEFLLIAIVILVGQWLIVNVGQEMFNVVPLKWSDWGIIIGATSVVFFVNECVLSVKTVLR